MAIINRLLVDRFRNLAAIDIHPSPGFNLVFGSNGSGKTSLLESIHVLSVGKSFRTHKTGPLIRAGESDFVLFAGLGERGGAGVSKFRNGKTELRLFGEQQSNWQSVAELLPLQVINSDSFALLDGGAKGRRRFMDWVMFHVEHSFIERWRAYRRCVAQRNSLLKRSSTGRPAIEQLSVWEGELASLGESIHLDRKRLFENYLPYFHALVSELLPDMTVGFVYKPGWDVERDLYSLLAETRDRDVRYGMTLSGPHRGDFVLLIDGGAASEVLSRGQTKMLVCALKIAAGKLLQQHYAERNERYHCMYLVDDLAAELDVGGRTKIIQLLRDSGAQCFFSAIQIMDLPLVGEITETSGKFHVEHGKIHAA